MVKRDRHYTLITVLSKTPAMRRLIDKASNLNTLNIVLREYLSPLAAKHCQVGNWEKGILTISTTSPAWKHHVRFYHMDLAKRLKQTTIFRDLKAINIIVTPDTVGQTEKANAFPPPAPLSMDSVEYIQTMLEYIDCPILKASLLRLANRAAIRHQAHTPGHHAQYIQHPPAHAPYYSPYAAASQPPNTSPNNGARTPFPSKANRQSAHLQDE
jgi:hypothetical protein